ncbi:MAG TPA: PKD domain-containing protein [Thermoplasmata archaeon]|nr:PKD domain-containing protein [Thermoplasmata archaeon]
MASDADTQHGAPLDALAATATATPHVGAVPLLVNFSLNATGGLGPYRYSWSFGDGNASAFPAPSHVFAAPGNYTAIATVTDAAGTSATQSVPIEVEPLPLTVALAATLGNASTGSYVTLTATPTGGSGPYVFAWSFGDGSDAIGTAATITHEYPRPGSYGASVRVTDGEGSDVVGATRVAIPTPPSPGPTCAPLGRPCGPWGVSDSAWAIALGLVLVVGLAAGWVFWTRQRRSAAPALGSTIPGGPTSSRPPGVSAPPTVRPGADPSPTNVAPSDRRTAPASVVVSSSSPEPDGRPLSERILIHLYRQGVPDANRAVPAAFTQDGMSQALSRPQGAFARALLRLEEAGLIRSELAHVQGRGRRAKTYRLTPQGESAARRLGASPPSFGR